VTLRIVHLGTKGLPARGGTERVVEALAVRQVRAGHEVTVYGSAAVAPTAVYRGVHVRTLPALPMKHLGPALLSVLAAGACAARRRYDVVHLHGTEHAFVLPALCFTYPVVMTSHGLLRSSLGSWSPLALAVVRSYERWSVRLPEVSTSVAAGQAEELTRRYDHRVAHIPNGVDCDERVDEAAAQGYLQSHSLEPKRFLMFAAGRVLPSKGCHLLLEAVRRIPEGLPVLVVGDLSKTPDYARQLARKAAGLRVVFAPPIEDKPTLLGVIRLAAAVVHPSMVEAMSMMLLETLSVGAICVASDIPENTAALPVGYPRFRAGDAVDLAAQLTGILSQQEEERLALANLGASWVREHFDWDDIVQRYEETYCEAIRTRRSAAKRPV
jgi:glycosyltransferase involved in cell wall biosynthesis